MHIRLFPAADGTYHWSRGTYRISKTIVVPADAEFIDVRVDSYEGTDTERIQQAMDAAARLPGSSPRNP